MNTNNNNSSDEEIAATTEAQKKSKKKKSDENGVNSKDESGPKFLDMYSSIYSMRQELDRIRKPVGSRENPVRTCKDLYYGHPQFKNGKYTKYHHDRLFQHTYDF